MIYLYHLIRAVFHFIHGLIPHNGTRADKVKDPEKSYPAFMPAICSVCKYSLETDKKDWVCVCDPREVIIIHPGNRCDNFYLRPSQ